MKKFREKISQLGKRKNCFIALLLVALIAFGIVTGLNGSKSGKIEANAFTETPAPKNLDLNGIRYTYQTSLNELKNDYGLYTNWGYQTFTIKENGEGVTELYLGPLQSEDDDVYTNSELNDLTSTIKDIFSIEYDNILIESIISNNNNLNISETIFEFDNAPSQTDITGIKINYDLLYNIPHKSISASKESLQYLNVIYVNQNNTNDIMVYTYADVSISNEVYYKFKKINNYNVMGIIGIRNAVNEEQNIENVLFNDGCPIDGFVNASIMRCTTNQYYVIEDLNFATIDNNYITHKTYYGTNEQPIFKGYLLLSETKYDKNLFHILDDTIPRPRVVVPLNSNAYFGGNFNNKYPVNNVYYYALENAPYGLYTGGYRINYNNFSNLYDSLFYKRFDENTITYQKQNRLLFLTGSETLTASYNNTEYDALSAQVEDILYNVNYGGNIKEIEFNEKVQDDFEDLLKTVGLGAFIGLLISLLFGINPALGASIGAIWGGLVSILPLIIDGLQSIFGYDFLSGLYDFFNNISEFFVNIVDSIINFLMSIITNPFILALIVIVAIVYLVYWLKNK